MDRLRDAGRRGSSGGSASICSYLRRPRSCGIKDSADHEDAMEDLNVARLRERPRKDCSNRSKRTRHSPREFVLPCRSEEVYEGAGCEVGASDEDENPVRPSRKPENFTLHGKDTRDESNAVDLPAVPRKARTAMAKRPHKGRQQDGSRQHYTSPIPSSATHISPSGLPLKPVKRMKHKGPKVKKRQKIAMSVTISEQEVEVAEALFDLARMVSDMGSPLSDSKMESKIEDGETRHTSSPESTPAWRSPIPTPPSSNSAVSYPTTGPTPVSPSHIPSSPVCKLACIKAQLEDRTLIEHKANELVKSATEHTAFPFSRGQCAEPKQVHGNMDVKASVDNISTCQHSLHDAPISVTPLPESAHLIQNANKNIALTWNRFLSIGVSNPTAKSGVPAYYVKKQSADECKLVDAGDALAEPLEKKVKIAEAVEYDINLLEQPHGSSNNDCVKVAKDEGELLKSDTNLGSSNMKVGRGQNMTKNGKDMQDMEMSRQEHTSIPENRKPEIVQQKETKRPGWEGGFSQPGYYPSKVGAAAAGAAVGAAWPNGGAAVPMDDKSQLKVPYFSFQGAQLLSKRCASHIYIAHFIDTQQQMQRHLVLTGANGNNEIGGVFSMNSLNATVPVPHFTLFGSGLSEMVGLSMRNSTVINSTIGHPKDKDSETYQNDKVAVFSTDASAKVDTSKLSATSHMKEEGTSMQVASGTMFCHGGGSSAPCNQSVGVGGNSTPHTGANIAALMASAGQSSKTPSANSAAAAQLQYLQAIIQQAGFPFSFPPGKLVPPNASNITIQQPTQYFCNPFYSPGLVNPPSWPQQGPATSRENIKTSSSQNQSPLVFQDGHGNLIQSHQQQQQQQSPLPSSSSSHSHHCNTSQHSHHVADLQGGKTIPLAESKVHGYQTNACSQEIPTNKHTTLSSSREAALPTLVALAQLGNMKLSQTSGQEQVQHESLTPTHALLYHQSNKVGLPMGVESMDYRAPHVSSSLPIRAVHPGSSRVASVAAVMPPQGHTILKTMVDTQLSDVQACKEQCQQPASHRLLVDASLEGRRPPSNSKLDDKSTLAIQAATRANMTKVDMEIASDLRGKFDTRNQAPLEHNQQSFPGGSFNFMASSFGSMGVGQVGAASSSGPVTSAVAILKHGGVLHGNTHTLSNTTSQYLSQLKPLSMLQAETTNASAPSSPLLSTSYEGYLVARHQGQPSRSLQCPVVSSQMMFPSAISSFASQMSTSTAGKTTSTFEVPSNFPQKHPSMVAPSTKQDSHLTHSSSHGVGSSSINAMSMDQSLEQQQSLQLAMKQHQQRQQQQQQHKQQYLSFHHDQFQHLHQVLPQQFNAPGVSSSITQQYHQSLSGANEAGQVGLLKQSQQHTKHLYSEQHIYQSMQQQMKRPQEHAAQPATEHRGIPAVNYNMQQVPHSVQQQQSGKHQAVLSCQQPPCSLASFGVSSSGALPTIRSSRGSIGISTGGPSCHVNSPTSNVCTKQPTSTSISAGTCNLEHRAAILNSGIPHLHSVGGACAKPLSSNSVRYLSFSQPTTLTSSAKTTEKSLGAAFMYPQNGTLLTNVASVAGVGRENGAMQHLNGVDRANTSPITPASGNSHSSVSGTSTKHGAVSYCSVDANNATGTRSSQVVGPGSQHNMIIDSTPSTKSSSLLGNTTGST